MQQARERDGATATKENSSFTWVVADDRRTTVAWLHNYWSDAYGINRPQFDAALLDTGGREVVAWKIDLPPDATEVIDVRARCREAGVPLPFEGQLLLRLEHDKVVPGRPVQVFAEYVHDDREVTGVHGQYGFMDRPVGQVVSGMRVDAGDGRRTAVILVNPYSGPGAPADLSAGLQVLDADGHRRRARVGGVPPRGTRRVYLDEVFPDLDGFLGGRPGHLRLQLPCASSRVATFLEERDGRWVANHGTVDRLFDQSPGIPADWTESWPVASTLVLCDERRDTLITFPNVAGPVGAEYDAVIDINRPDGSRITSHVLRVPARGIGEVALRDVLLAAGETLPVVAHAIVSLRPVAAVSERPAVVDVLVGFVDDGLLVGEVQVGGEFYNAPVPPGVRAPDIRRTRTFGRVVSGQGRTSSVFLANPAGTHGYDVVARPVLTLLDLTGERRSTAELEIRPHGCAYVSVPALFPDATDVLGPGGEGVLRVRDTGARLYGFYFVETEGARSVPICHLVGG